MMRWFLLLAGLLAACTAEPTGTPVPTARPTLIPIAAPTETPTPTPAVTPTLEPTATPEPEPAAVPTAIPTPTKTPTPVSIPTPNSTPTPTHTPTARMHFAAILPWFVAPPDDAHTGAVQLLTDLWQRDPSLADAVARLPWVADGMTDEESDSVATFLDEAGDAEAAKAVLGYRWVVDGIAPAESPLWRRLLHLTGISPALAQRVTSFPWLADGLVEQEGEALMELENILQRDEELGNIVLDYPWLAEDAGYDDTQVLYGLARIARSDPDLAKRVAGFPWLADAEVTNSHQWMPLDDLNIIASRDRALANQLGDFLSDGLRWRTRHMMSNLRAMVQERRDGFQQLSSQPWFQDGLNAEEAAFLATTRDIWENSPSDFSEMLQTRYIQSSTIDLPLSGEVNIWAIQKAPFPQGDTLVADIEHAIRSLEQLTQVPAPVEDFIVLMIVIGPDSVYEPAESNLAQPWPRAAHTGSHARVSRYQEEPYNRSTLFHELAHYYFGFFPAWFLEGGAEFAPTTCTTPEPQVALTPGKLNWAHSSKRVAPRTSTT